MPSAACSHTATCTATPPCRHAATLRPRAGEASVREHVSWEAGQARRERLTLHRRARRVEGTCATSEQRARSALSATLAARRYGQGSLHTRCEQGGVGSDPPPGLAIQRARVCGFEAHMLARAAPKVGLTHGIPARGKEGRRVLNSGPGISGGRTVRGSGDTFSGSTHPALHGAPV